MRARVQELGEDNLKLQRRLSAAQEALREVARATREARGKHDADRYKLALDRIDGLVRQFQQSELHPRLE